MSLRDWTNLGPLGTATHVTRVQSASGRVAVLKRPRLRARDKSGQLTKAGRRFVAEARETYSLRSNDGVIRVLDREPGKEPLWYVCELGVLLAEHLGDTPDLWDVVSAVADIGDTLADLTVVGVHHRDIKPANLLYARGRAVVADFGIAVWPKPLQVTTRSEKVGPAYFLAPEMRYGAREAKPGPADVYSLAKTLFVLALPEFGRFPPGGCHYADAREFSLYRSGQRTAHEIEALLESATSERPAYRPTMRAFANELRDWLSTTDPSSAVRPNQPAVRRGIGPELDAELAVIERRSKNLTHKLRRAGSSLEASLSLPPNGLRWKASRTDLLRQSYDTVGPPDDGPDAFACFASSYQRGDRRVVIAGAVWHSTVTYFAEIQSRTRDGSSPVRWALDPTVTGELEHPSGSARLVEIVRQVAGVMNTTSGRGTR